MARRKPAASLAAEILDHLPPRKHGFDPWEKRIPAQDLAELELVREQWHSGQIASPGFVLARRISEILKERGLATVGPQGVVRWLKEKRA
jgi:hypothetical protein